MEPHEHGRPHEASDESAFASGVSYALSRLKMDKMELKPKQVEAIRLLYERKDAFVWLPTGYGKSICFQISPYMFDFKLGRISAASFKRSIIVIVSPLLSLMIDQVTDLKSRGVQAAILSGNHDVDPSFIATESDVKEGKYSHLYSCPETIVSADRWRQMLADKPLSEQVVAIVIDEAHCVYKW